MAQFVASTVEVQGHRGDRQHCPENSIHSFISALKMGVDTIELDLLLTKDHQVVIHHNYRLNPDLCVHMNGSPIVSSQYDALLEQQSNNNSSNEQSTPTPVIDTEMITDIPLISQLTLDQLKQYDIGSKTLARFPEQMPVPKLTIPTLEELFTAVNEHYKQENEWELALHQRTGCGVSTRPLMRYNLEIKREWDRPEEVPPVEIICETILEVVKRYGMESRVSYSSFDLSVLQELRRLDASIPLSFLYYHIDCEQLPVAPASHTSASIDVCETANASVTDVIAATCKAIVSATTYKPSVHLQEVVQTALKLKAVVVSPDHRLITCREDVFYLQSQSHCRVVLWTVNEPSEWARLVDFGVDGLITDYPRGLLHFLHERESAVNAPVGPVSINESISR